MPVNWTVVSVVLSTFRSDGDIVRASLQSLVSDPTVASVHVWGDFVPPLQLARQVHQHPLTRTLYHAGVEKYSSSMTSDVLCRRDFKWCTSDHVNRVRWRSTLSLNMWQVLSAARRLFPNNVLMYTENDAIVIPGRLPIAIGAMRATGSAAASCYQPPGSFRKGGGTYQGSGNVCFLLTPTARPESHLLSYHMVQPADWIMSDYSRGTWPVHKVATHGIPGKAHKSTFGGS